MAIVETVKIVSKNKEGHIVINKEDFTNKHKIFKTKLETKPEVKLKRKAGDTL